ncbi:uncharacterized protein LOC110849944 [Folsomia candida]|uniref:Uncharacterized protein n=1 Tax=Folsomia candida TaxID=158441 RepID=A0A226E8G9_FOLCA|nr:uncharacterized protein LOC110849944 [Folsomia candida]OXA53620.1 hypothetical protein Fcan01_10556 [Folsomia candida]
MLTKNEAREIIFFAFSNMFVGPAICMWGMYPQFRNYMDESEAKNFTGVELALKYYPVFWANASLIFCSSVSGLCADVAVMRFLDIPNWRIKLGKVATFLSTSLWWQALLFIFYDVDPMKWRTPDGTLASWGPIELSVPTILYYVFVQLYFSEICYKLV